MRPPRSEPETLPLFPDEELEAFGSEAVDVAERRRGGLWREGRFLLPGELVFRDPRLS